MLHVPRYNCMHVPQSQYLYNSIVSSYSRLPNVKVKHSQRSHKRAIEKFDVKAFNTHESVSRQPFIFSFVPKFLLT